MNHAAIGRALSFIGTLGVDFAHAGATQVFITCKAKDIVLEASFPGDMLGASVTLKTKAATAAYLDESAVEDAKMNNRDLKAEYPQGYKVSPIAGVDQLAEMQVLTLIVLDGGYPEVTLTSQPKSVKVQKTANGQVGSFDAKLSTQGADTIVACKYQYEI